MHRLEFARIAGVAMLALALLLPPMAARAGSTGGTNAAADAAAVADLPMPRALTPEVGTYRVVAVAFGTMAGAIIGNLLTGGLMTPILSGGLAGPGLAGASVGAYAVGAITTTFFAGIGAYVGVWMTSPPSQSQ